MDKTYSMHKITSILSFVVFVIGIGVLPVSAQTVGVVCSNARTKAITVEKTKCPTGTTRLSLANLTASSVSSCYTATATNADAVPSGRVVSTVACRSGYFVQSDSFDVRDQTGKAKPALSSKTFTFARGSKIPTGVEFELIGTANTYYSVTAQAVCCP